MPKQAGLVSIVKEVPIVIGGLTNLAVSVGIYPFSIPPQYRRFHDAFKNEDGPFNEMEVDYLKGGYGSPHCI